MYSSDFQYLQLKYGRVRGTSVYFTIQKKAIFNSETGSCIVVVELNFRAKLQLQIQLQMYLHLHLQNNSCKKLFKYGIEYGCFSRERCILASAER